MMAKHTRKKEIRNTKDQVTYQIIRDGQPSQETLDHARQILVDELKKQYDHANEAVEGGA